MADLKERRRRWRGPALGGPIRAAAIHDGPGSSLAERPVGGGMANFEDMGSFSSMRSLGISTH
jgi:hypothetical protein